MGNWFYITFALAGPLLFQSVIWIGFIISSSHRKNDPYRFSRIQYRYLDIPYIEPPQVIQTLMRLGYFILAETNEENHFHLVAGRVKSTKPLPHQKEKFQTALKMEIHGLREVNSWNITIKAYPFRTMVVADFKNTIYDSLEEAIDELGWRSNLV